MRKVFVECRRGSAVIATYEVSVPASLAAPPVMPDREDLISEAKTNLTNQGLAFPPYEGIEFRIRSN